jgi:hypothetical protein
MVIASSYPLLSIFATMAIFFFFLIWLSMLAAVLLDIFRRDDISGWGKAGWTIFAIVLPYIGVLVYIGIHGGDMTERTAPRRASVD